ncbi:MAG: sugar phosphate isomerase/epimerase family protein [Armatimonadota bacterium]
MRRALGISTSMLSQQLTPENLCATAQVGVQVVEVYTPLGCELHADDACVERTAAALSEAGLKVWSVHAPFGGTTDLSDPDELHRRESVGAVARAVEIAGMFGARLVVVHAGLTAENPDECELRRRQSLRSINCLLKRTAQLGVWLAVEYLPANKPRLCNDSAAILDFVRFCDGCLAVCLDTNHANLREPLADAIRTLGSRIQTVHISDNDGVQERHWLPGDGVIDWGEFISLLDLIDYTGPLMMEAIEDRPVPELMARTAARAREHLGWEPPDGA